MFEILSPDLHRIGEVELISSDNHSIHWQESGTMTLIATATEANLRNLRNDRFVLIRDAFRQGDRLDGLYLICNIIHDEEKNEITVNGKTAGFLLHQRVIGDTVLTGTTAGAALAALAAANARGLPIEAEWESAGDPEVIRYPMDGGALDEKCTDLMAYCGIGMEAALKDGSIQLRFSPGRDISTIPGVPVLGKHSGWARNANFSIDASDYCNVAVGNLVFDNNNEEPFSFGETEAAGSSRRELFIGDISQIKGESDTDFRERANTEAQAKLVAHLLRTTISADISPADYGRPFLVGDVIRVQVGAVTMKKRIAAATWLHDQNNDRITLTLGDKLNTVPAEIKEKQKATAAGAAGAGRVALATKKAQDGIERDFKILLAQVTDVVAGMNSYVLNKVFEDYKLASARLFAELRDEDSVIKSDLALKASSIKGLQEASADLTTKVDGAEAKISLNAKSIEDMASSMATIEADVVKLKGDTEILGNLSIVDGKLKSSKGIVSDSGITGSSIYANGTGSQGIVSGRRVSCTEIAVGGKDYKPTEITSTTGTVLVLGFA